MPDPSFLPSAASVAKHCYDEWVPNEALDASLQDDVDKLAGFFHARGDFSSVFIRLVPWDKFGGEPNEGHAAIGDLLVCRAAHAVLSGNFDTMIERWVQQRKISIDGAIDGHEATNFSGATSPLLKFHGCMQRRKEETLWTKVQLSDSTVSDRINSCSQWINLHLPGKHLVIVGFWTDWGYLNEVLANAFTITNALSVTVVDPCTEVELREKAPQLWQKLNALSGSFLHVQESGDTFLAELRLAYSKTWAKQFYALGKPSAAELGITTKPSPDALTTQDLYDLRRDAEGVPYTTAASQKSPHSSAGEAALTHIMFLDSGAIQSGAWLEIAGRKIRVVNGSGRELSDIRQSHKEPAAIEQPDIVLCAGAMDFGVPGRLIASGEGSSVVSPAPGGSAKWLTREQALSELEL